MTSRAPVKRFAALLLVALLALPVLATPLGAPGSPYGVALPAETASLVDPRLALMAAAPERIGELGGAPAPEGEISVIARVDGLRGEHRDYVTALDGEVVSWFPRFETFGVVVPLESLPALTRLPGLVWLEPDVMFYPALDNSVASLRTTAVWSQFGFRGENVTIAILDTGVDFAHESLDDLDDIGSTDDPKIAVDADGKLAFYNANTDKEYPDEQPHDSGSHGTHVAGIAAGTGGPSGTYAGVAPQARLAGVIALDGGGGDTNDLLRSVNWTIANRDRFNIRVMSLSLGGPVVIPGATNDGQSSISQALDAAVESGIVTTVAIGNGNLGVAAHPGSVTYPGDSERAITVGSVNDNHNREIYSSRGPTGDGRLKPDVMAPGGGVMSAQKGSGDGYVSYSGTSMSAPHVAGLAALMVQANPQMRPDATSSPYKQIMRETSDHRVPFDLDCGEFYSPNNCYGWGTVDALGAVQRSLDLRSGSIAGPPEIPVLENASFTLAMDYTRTEHTTRGEDGGTIQNYPQGEQPDSVRIEARWSAAWPAPASFELDADAADGLASEEGLWAGVEGDERFVRAWFNYTGEPAAGAVLISHPTLRFDLGAPAAVTETQLRASFALNNNPGISRAIEISSYSDPPDLRIEELRLQPEVPLPEEEVQLVARIINEGLGRARSFSVEFSLDGEPLGTREGSLDPQQALNLALPWTAVLGEHEFAATLVDISPSDADDSDHNATLSATVTDILDTQPPLVFITAPHENEILSGTVTVSGTAEDNYAVRRVEVRVAPAEWETASGTTDWSWEWNTTGDLNGRYRIEARAWDGFNYSSSAKVEVEITNDDANRRPTARLSAEPLELEFGEPVVFSGNGSSDDSQVAGYAFDFGDGDATGWASQSWVRHTYLSPGSYTATLEVQDDEGAHSSAPASVTITVLDEQPNQPPLALIALPQPAAQLSAGTITLSAVGSSDPDGDPLLFVWSSDRDGHLVTTSSFEATATLSAGAHLLTLEVRDGEGGEAVATVEVEVRAIEREDSSFLPAPSALMAAATLVGVTLLLAARRDRSRRG